MNTMMKMLLGVAAGMALSAQGALPGVENVTVSLSSNARTVEIGYDLTGTDAIVTFDIETNAVGAAGVYWTSIGLTNVHHAVGDVFRLVDPGTGRKIYWCAEQSWPGHTIESADSIRAVVKAVTTNTPPNYMVCDLITGKRAYYDDVGQLPGGIQSDAYRKHLFVMRKIPARGKVMRLGTNPAQKSYNSTTDQQVSIGFTYDYYMAVFEFTQWQWHYVAVTRGGYTAKTYTPTWAGDLRPFDGGGTLGLPYGILGNGDHSVPSPVGTDADYKISGGVVGKMRTLTGLGLRLHLPTQLQWEYACRAGESAEFCNGGSISNANETVNASLDKVGRYAGNANGNGTANVGSYAPNAWGLYDMHGNVREWCRDRGEYKKDREFEGQEDGIVHFDPIGETSATYISTLFNSRGGAWNSNPKDCASGYRSTAQCWLTLNYGFRLCYVLP